MTTALPWLSLVCAAALAASLIAYAVTGGADFGGGLWDLLARGPRRTEQRRLVANAIAPIWEANHVWLILAIVILFTAFPRAFGRVTTVLHIPLLVMLLGIVLRGTAFTFRSYDSRRDAVQRRWGVVFSIASTITPVVLGIVVGAVASGRTTAPPATPDFVRDYVSPWLTPFTIAVGGMTLALFAMLAAVYLTVEARDNALVEDFRTRALGAAIAVGACALVALLLARRDAPVVWASLTHGVWAALLHGATAVAALTVIWALVARRFRVARVAAPAQVALIIAGWAVGQFPFIVPPDLSLAESAPRATLSLLIGALVVGLIVLVPSLNYLFRIFKGIDQE